jgi:hypothetical protein
MLLIRNSFSVVNTDRFFFRSHCAQPANQTIFQELSAPKICRSILKTSADDRERGLPRADFCANQAGLQAGLTHWSHRIFNQLPCPDFRADRVSRSLAIQKKQKK